MKYSYKIKIFIVCICLSINFIYQNTNVFASTYTSYDECKNILNSDYFTGNIEDVNIIFNDKEYKSKKFMFSNTIYLPLRTIMSILNKEIQYNNDEKLIDIIDGDNEFKYIDVEVRENHVKKNYATVRYNGAIISHYIGNSINDFYQPPTFLNIDDSLYMKINILAEDFNYIYFIEDNNFIKIEEINDISQITNMNEYGHKSTTFYLDEEEYDYDINRLNKLLQYQKNLHSGPDSILDQKYQFVIYKNAYCICIETTVKQWSNNVEKKYEVLYSL